MLVTPEHGRGVCQLEQCQIVKHSKERLKVERTAALKQSARLSQTGGVLIGPCQASECLDHHVATGACARSATALAEHLLKRRPRGHAVTFIESTAAEHDERVGSERVTVCVIGALRRLHSSQRVSPRGPGVSLEPHHFAYVRGCSCARVPRRIDLCLSRACECVARFRELLEAKMRHTESKPRHPGSGIQVEGPLKQRECLIAAP